MIILFTVALFVLALPPKVVSKTAVDGNSLWWYTGQGDRSLWDLKIYSTIIYHYNPLPELAGFFPNSLLLGHLVIWKAASLVATWFAFGGSTLSQYLVALVSPFVCQASCRLVSCLPLGDGGYHLCSQIVSDCLLSPLIFFIVLEYALLMTEVAYLCTFCRAPL